MGALIRQALLALVVSVVLLPHLMSPVEAARFGRNRKPNSGHHNRPQPKMMPLGQLVSEKALRIIDGVPPTYLAVGGTLGLSFMILLFGGIKIYKAKREERERNCLDDAFAVVDRFSDLTRSGKWKPLPTSARYMVAIAVCLIVAVMLGIPPDVGSQHQPDKSTSEVHVEFVVPNEPRKIIDAHVDDVVWVHGKSGTEPLPDVAVAASKVVNVKKGTLAKPQETSSGLGLENAQVKSTDEPDGKGDDTGMMAEVKEFAIQFPVATLLVVLFLHSLIFSTSIHHKKDCDCPHQPIENAKSHRL